MYLVVSLYHISVCLGQADFSMKLVTIDHRCKLLYKRNNKSALKNEKSVIYLK